ncbi:MULTISPECIES: NAD(P)-binding domain-containing protein [Catenuloplanes]|uniref:3-hydroxyisobutyrate dehydrogenase-like beta-hydroxyacid dehydrogenase n=1 Tax=Catenuloplanes niger TaxID=587534 RepID=A0AAE4CR43_9ACTN|nr:NAD(P)-binding domain-containing protein [Catenuloplanes niger]MDR7322421.1 3-hydroxyisobutyrate dehydrogenase-like beta-hydroxyacid dehydrogenase [Catenuloplanes niger]
MVVSVIGTGAIGAAAARALLGAGQDVVVWNRTPDRASPLVAAGARRAGTLRAAGGDPVLLALTGYPAVRECLDGLGESLSGRTVVALCTGTPAEARAAAARAADLGAAYLDAGVQAAPGAIGTPAATFLYAGSRAVFDAHAATLGLLGTARFVGEAPDAAAVWDLALFGLWYDAQLGLLRALDTVRAAGGDLGEFVAAAGVQLGHVAGGVPATVGEMRDGTYPPGPATLAEHLAVLRRLAGTRAGGRLGDGGLAAVLARVEALVAAGRAGEGLTALTATS